MQYLRIKETNIKNIERHNNFIHKIIKDYKLKTFEPSEEDIKYINLFYENFILPVYIM